MFCYSICLLQMDKNNKDADEQKDEDEENDFDGSQSQTLLLHEKQTRQFTGHRSFRYAFFAKGIYDRYLMISIVNKTNTFSIFETFCNVVASAGPLN